MWRSRSSAEVPVDQSIPIPLALKLAADLNAHGTRPDLHISPAADHGGATMPSQADSLPFLAGPFA